MFHQAEGAVQWFGEKKSRVSDAVELMIHEKYLPTAYRLQSTVCNPRELGRHQSQSIASGYAWLKRECTDNIPTSSPIGTLPYLHVPTGRSQVQPYRYRQARYCTSYEYLLPPRGTSSPDS